MESLYEEALVPPAFRPCAFYLEYFVGTYQGLSIGPRAWLKPRSAEIDWYFVINPVHLTATADYRVSHPFSTLLPSLHDAG